jgi:hypothetical protein
MTPARQTIATMPASDVAFHGDEIALGESFDVIAHPMDHTDEFMADRHWHRNRFLCPGVPVVDVNIGPADRSLENADQNIVRANFWHWNFFEP